MPSNPATSKAIQSSTNSQPNEKSLSQMAKGAGFKDLTDDEFIWPEET
jgi:hypothetical protein